MNSNNKRRSVGRGASALLAATVLAGCGLRSAEVKRIPIPNASANSNGGNAGHDSSSSIISIENSKSIPPDMKRNAVAAIRARGSQR